MAITPDYSSSLSREPINSSGTPIVNGTFSIVNEVERMQKTFFDDLVTGLDEFVQMIAVDFAQSAQGDAQWSEYFEYLTAYLSKGDLVLTNNAPDDIDQEMADLEYGTPESAPNSLFRMYVQNNKASIDSMAKAKVDRLVPYV